MKNLIKSIFIWMILSIYLLDLSAGLKTLAYSPRPSYPLVIIRGPYLPVAVNNYPEPLTGKIAFVSDRDGNFEIYSMDPDGSDVVRLTNNPASDGNPDWSPDGSKILFDSNREGNSKIYVMNADGSGIQRITDSPAGDGNPKWSPDGTQIVFERHLPPDLGQIFIMNADGSQVIWLTDHPGGAVSPSWSHDGNAIVFRTYYDGIYTMDTDGQNQTYLWGSNTCREPILSPVADLLAVATFGVGFGQIGVYNISSHQYTELTNGTWDSEMPAWSPGGTMIVYVFNEADNRDLYIMKVDGTQLKRITNNPADDSSPDWTR